MSIEKPANPDTGSAGRPEQALQDIRQMMERSSRFISLSGLSGITAGVCALVAAWIARVVIDSPGSAQPTNGSGSLLQDPRVIRLVALGAGTLFLALTSALLLTLRKARKDNKPLWDHTSRRLLWNVMLPVLAGGLFILGMLEQGEWRFISPACLLFYGLGLVNGSKYTFSNIRYLGYGQVLLGLACLWIPGYDLVFWAFGFGVLHIFYGAIMWWKYERN